MRSCFNCKGSRFRNLKKCMRKNHDFRFAALFAKQVHLGRKF